MSDGMKMVMIAYNEAMDGELMDTLRSCSLKNYTKLPKAFGKGTTSGTHFGDDVWPGLNNVLYVACGENEARQLLGSVRELRKRFGQEGIKAFSWNLEEIT
ncbi:MAG: hypothetical protein PHE61_05525 [Candidatus Omnitrophica bacterium]|nr:hypothetical protein [Candidatus Omnitrophota bacterium]